MTSTRLAVAAVALALSACATPTRLTNSWLNPDYQPGARFTKTAVVAVTADPANREAAENAMAELVADATQSYKFLTTEDLADGAKVSEKLKSEGFDGLIVMSVIGFDPLMQPQVGAGVTVSKVQYAAQPATTELLRVETQIFSLAEDRLIWSGLTSSFDPPSVQKAVKDIAAAVVEDLKRRQVL